MTRRCNLEYIGRNAIRLPSIQPPDFITMFDHDHHSHIDINRFLESPSKSAKSPSPVVLAAGKSLQASNVTDVRNNWPALRRVIDRVHKHV